MLFVFYRIVDTDPAKDWDFTSPEGRGRRPRLPASPSVLRFWSGLSVYKNEWEVHQLATNSPRLGRFIAEVHVPADAAVRVQFDTGGHGHCTLWGNPTLLNSFVDVVVPV